jgi:hypothetical protein
VHAITSGAAGATEFVQWVNNSLAVFDKTSGAVVLGPVAGNTIFNGFGGPCQTRNDGDPIVEYDKAVQEIARAQPGAPERTRVAMAGRPPAEPAARNPPRGALDRAAGGYRSRESDVVNSPYQAPAPPPAGAPHRGGADARAHDANPRSTSSYWGKGRAGQKVRKTPTSDDPHPREIVIRGHPTEPESSQEPLSDFAATQVSALIRPGGEGKRLPARFGIAATPDAT